MHGFNLPCLTGSSIQSCKKAKSLGSVCCVYSDTSHFTANTLPASPVVLAALPHRHLRLLLQDQVISGAQSSLDSLLHIASQMVFHAVRILG